MQSPLLTQGEYMIIINIKVSERLYEELWGFKQVLVILSFALNLGLWCQIPRYPRNDKKGTPQCEASGSVGKPQSARI